MEVIPDDAGEIIDPASLMPALQSIKASLNISGDMPVSVYVYKVNHDGEGNDFRVYESDDPEAFVLKNIARRFGSGSYRVRVYVTDNEGMKTMRVNSIQHVLLDPDDESKALAAREAAKNPPPPGAAHGGEMRDVVAQMMAGFQASIVQIMGAREAAPDPFALMERMAGIMKAMAPAPVAPAPDLQSMLGTLKTLKDLTGGGAPEGASASEQLLLKAADALMPAIAAGVAKGQPPAAPAGAALPAPGPDAGPQLSPEDEDRLMMLQLQLRMANRAAARGADPAEYANDIYDAFDDEDIQGTALNPEWFTIMCNAVPGCAEHREWYEKARAALIEMAIEDNLLARAADGALTLPADSGTKEPDTKPKGEADGTIATGGDSAAA